MHIIMIHQHFAIPTGCACLRSYEFARRWVRAGHKVTVIAATSDRSGLDAGEKSSRRRVIEGINIVISSIKYSNNQSFFRRSISFLLFVLFSIYTCLRTKKVDVVYAISPPLTSGIPAILLKCLKRVPFVFEVCDEWVEAAIQMGYLKNRILIKIALWFEKTIYKHSSAIVPLSIDMAEGIRVGLTTKGKRIVTIPNGCETDLFQPGIEGSAIRKKYEWGNKFVLLHAGAMGMANSLDFVIDACIELKNNSDILFVLLGQGAKKSALESRIQKLGLINVQILPSVPQKQMSEIYAAVDIGMVIVDDYPIMEHNSAAKFFDTLIAGKPVLLNYSGWQRDVIEANNAGYGCEQYDLKEFVEKVLYLNSHREEVLDMGRNARQIGIEKYDRQKLAMESLEVISSAQRNNRVSD